MDLKIPSNLKYITSNTEPTTDVLKVGEAAFGVVAGIPCIFGNSDGTIQSYLGHLVSLNYAAPIEASTDLNTLTKPGNYVSQTQTITASLTNKPKVTSYFRLFVSNFTATGTVISQLVVDYKTGKQFYRYGSGSTWGEWTEEVLVTDLNAKAEELNGLITANVGRIEEIETKIPEDASVDNKMASESYVKATVRGSASRYIVPAPDDTESQSTVSQTIWKSLEALTTAAQFYYAGKPVTDLTSNDYATVEVHRQIEGSEVPQHEFWQALYSEVDDVGSWDMQFKLGSYLSNEQQLALDSGVSATWKKSVETQLAGKLDKVTTNDTKERAYTVSTTGVQQVTPISDAADGGTLAKRDEDGHLVVADPTLATHAATKDYVDSTTSSKVSAAQSTLQKAVDAEKERATSAEKTNADAITAEQTRATAEEKKISDALDQAKTDLEALVAAEETRATTAEGELRDSISSLTTDSGTELDVTLDTETYTITLNLKNKAGTTISTKSFDLPIEDDFTDAYYDAETKRIVFTANNDSTTFVGIGELIDGLVTSTALASEVETLTQADKDLAARIDELDTGSSAGMSTKQPLLKPALEGTVQAVLRPAVSDHSSDVTGSMEITHLSSEVSTESMKLLTEGVIDSRISSATKEVSDALQEEVATRQSEDTAIRASLTQEVERAQGAEGTLTDLKTNAKNNLVAAINEEIGRATAAEKKNADDIAAETSARTTAVSDLSDELAAEVERSTAQDTTLQSNIDKEAARAKGEESRIEGLVTAEETRATEAEQALSDRLDALSESSEGLEREIERATGEEARIEGLITKEIADRKLADTSTLSSAKTYADGLHSTAMSAAASAETNANEYTDQQLASKADELTQSLQQYTDDAIGDATSGLSTQITDLSSKVSANTKSITDEVTRATAAEKVNATAISTEQSERKAADTALQTALDEAKAKIPESISMSMDSTNYILTVKLLDSGEEELATATVDLPLETMVVNGSYDSAKKEIVLTLKNGKTVSFSVGDLVSGLASNSIFGVSKNGLVPGPATASGAKFLRDDGTWQEIKTSSARREIDVRDSGGISKGGLASSSASSLQFKEGSHITFDFEDADGVGTLTISAEWPDMSLYALTSSISTIGKTGKLSDATGDTGHRTVTDAQITAWNAKQAALSFDTTPTQDSLNPVTSGGLYTALAGKLTSISASGGITATKSGTTYSLSHTNSITAGAASEGGAARTLSFGGTFNIPTINYDANGHVISTSKVALTLPSNPNTHYVSHLYVGAKGGKANAATTNGNTYLELYDDTTSRASFKISGTSGVSVASDGSGNITITGPGTSVSANDGTLTVQGSGGLTGSGTFTANQSADSTITISHAAKASTLSNLTASSRRYVTALTFDSYGHVTGYSTGTETVTNTDTHYTSHLYVGATGKNSSASTSNGATYIKLYDNTYAREEILIKGTQNVSVASDTSGNITITGPNLSGYATTSQLSGYASSSHTHDARYLQLSGGDLTGTVQMKSGTRVVASINTSGYVTGTWLATTAATDLGETSSKIAVIGTSGSKTNYIYYRTPSEIRSDIGAAASSHTHSVSDVSGLSTQLAGKASTSHTHDNYALKTDFNNLKERVDTFFDGDTLEDALDTLHGLQEALDNDESFAASITEQLAGKAASNHTHTGMVTGTSLTSNAVILGNGSSGIKALATGTSGQVLTLSSTGVPTWQTPASFSNTAHSHTAGTGLSVSGSGGTSGSVSYSLNKATATTLGGIIVAAVRSSTVSPTTGGTTSGKYYGVELDSEGKAFVHVPWQNTTALTASGSNGITITGSGTASITVKGVTATTSAIGVAYLHKEADCSSYSSDNGGATPAAVKKAIITEDTKTSGLNSTFNATQTHRGTMSKDDKTKLDGIEDGANNYSLPQATSSALGGIKIGATGLSSKQYAVQLNSSGQAYVSVPWADATANTSHSHAAGTGLSVSGSWGISGGTTTYSLNVADDGALGGVALGYAQTGTNYPVELDEDNKAYVAVPWTDDHVTSADNHYTPTAASGSALTATASSTSSASWGSTSLVTGITLSRDAKGHVTSMSVNSIRMPSQPSFTLSAATSSSLGGIRIGYTKSGMNVPVQLNSSNQAYVTIEIPFEDWR